MIIMLVFLVICLVLLIGQISRANSERDSYANENQFLKEKISRLKGEDPQTKALLIDKDTTIKLLTIELEGKEKLESEVALLRDKVKKLEECELKLMITEDLLKSEENMLSRYKGLEEISDEYIESLKSIILKLGENICFHKRGFAEIHIAASNISSSADSESLSYIKEKSEELYSFCDTSMEVVDSVINYDKSIDADDYNNDDYYDDLEDDEEEDDED